MADTIVNIIQDTVAQAHYIKDLVNAAIKLEEAKTNSVTIIPGISDAVSATIITSIFFAVVRILEKKADEILLKIEQKFKDYENKA